MKHRKAAKSQAQPPTTPTATEPKATESAAAAKTPDQTVAGWFIQMTSVDNAGFCNFPYFP